MLAHLRAVAAVGQAATILVTWPLWQTRTTPPTLPLVDALDVSYGLPLLLSLLLVLWRPTLGTLAHGLLLALAMLGDQTREQPHVISLALLLAASAIPRRGATFAAIHLAALWFWAGVGKATSARFWTYGSVWLLDPAVTDRVGGGGNPGLGALVVAVEIALPILVLWPRTRRPAAWCACLFHLGVLCLLSPLGRDWNPAVWPWNAVLAIAAPLVFVRDDVALSSVRRRLPVALAAVALCIALPLGFHLGRVDAPFAFQVYAGNALEATVLHADGRTTVAGELAPLRTILPPVPRIVRAWFLATGSAGDRLVLVERRPFAAWTRAPDALIAFPRSEVRP